MKTTLFTCKTTIGTFWIRPEPADRVQLGLDGHKLKTYSSAKAAARAVAERATGWTEWDTATGNIAPASLEKWKRVSAGSKRTPSQEREERTQDADVDVDVDVDVDERP